jgi:AraC-like DNA-binding protein
LNNNLIISYDKKWEIKMANITNAVARYLPLDPVQKIWGLHIVDGGFTEIPPKTKYPPGHHPAEYSFNWQNGRVLDEYQLVYITDGEGTFESANGGSHSIVPGTVFLLFPGEWHRYQPNFETGWHENWIGFKGTYVQKLMDKLFSHQKPVMHIGLDNELLHLMRTVTNAMLSLQPGYQELIAGYTVASLARLRLYSYDPNQKTSVHNELISQARMYILEHLEQEIDLQLLARKLGMSYSGFRAKFKAITGLSPRQFQIQIRINKAQELLLQTSLPVSRIGDDLGFCSLYYFSNIFKRKMGVCPSEYRNRGLTRPRR